VSQTEHLMISFSNSEDISSSMTTGKMISTSISPKESPTRTKISNKNSFGLIGHKSTRKNLQSQSNLMTMKFLKSIQMKFKTRKKIKTQIYPSSQHLQNSMIVILKALKTASNFSNLTNHTLLFLALATQIRKTPNIMTKTKAQLQFKKF